MSMAIKAMTLVGLGAATLLAYCLTRRMLKRRRYNKRPNMDGWQRVGTVQAVNLYPIKSCAAMALHGVTGEQFGVSCHCFVDRRLMLYNNEGNALSATQYPKMLSIRAELLTTDVLRLIAPNVMPLHLDLKRLLRGGQLLSNDKNDRYEIILKCKPSHQQWFSRVLTGTDTGASLVMYMGPIMKKCWLRRLQRPLMPITVIHNKSIDDLNSRLDEMDQVDDSQFRGNVLIESFEHIKAFDEDNWMWLRIGDNVRTSVLRYKEPRLCNIMVNINTVTCERNKNFEPLKTLKKYRLRSNAKKPEMGVFFSVYKTGAIKNGDPVYVQYKM